MPASLKVDEDLPREVTLLLREHGHDAKSVVEQGLGGSPDAEVLAAAAAKKAVPMPIGK